MDMNIKEFVKNFANQFEDTDIDVFTPETKFRELAEWSSILGLSVILMVDEEYGVTLKASDVQSATTIEELFNVVQSKL